MIFPIPNFPFPIPKKRDCFVPRNATRFLVLGKIEMHPGSVFVSANLQGHYLLGLPLLKTVESRSLLLGIDPEAIEVTEADSY